MAVCGQAPPRRRHGRLRDQRLVLGLVLWLRLQQLLVALRIGQEVKGGLHLLVGAQRVLHGAPLIVVSGHDVVVENLADALLIEVEVFGQVGLQLLPQGVELSLGIIVIAFKLSQLLEASSDLALMASYLKWLLSTLCLNSS